MHVELLSIGADDLQELAAFYASEIWPYHSGPPLTTQRVWDRFSAGDYTGPGRRSFWIIRDGRRHGVLRVWDLGTEHDTATPLFDIRVTSTSRGMGIGTDAVSKLVEWIFRAYPVKSRIEATTRDDNFAMQHVLDRCGFVKEAHYRQCWPGEEGKIHDCFGYAILRSDWETGTITPVVWTEGSMAA